MSEIKLKADLVQQKLTDLQNSVADFQSGKLDKGSGREMLDVQAKINDINVSLNSLIQEYQDMAVQHVEASKDAVDSLEKTEQAVAEVIDAFTIG
ncbi:YwqI/YxiC family protein [Terribacillus sp. 179-K 1B1 HS]|uniref:YwqI/YxiC family protein n=1 Tax=Terribacillus sp. 179-K 1B1 HS TaxID=3142388 RepID=UPI0039A26226